MIKIKLHKDDCTMCGECSKIMPTVFIMGKKEVKLFMKTLSDDKLKKLEEVLEYCAGDAIELLD